MKFNEVYAAVGFFFCGGGNNSLYLFGSGSHITARKIGYGKMKGLE
jgi:hypothetical protein